MGASVRGDQKSVHEADHLHSLARLREMDVKLALPGHGSPFRDHRKRIGQLLSHHEKRSEAAYSAGKKWERRL
jgi:glyoxylase-like metal-dependent hydrolase (beta-lactamase superfamily II)